MARCLLFPAAAAAAAPAAPIVHTTNGAVRGVSRGGVVSFLGIPFAADTGGANRWRPPQPRAAWGGIRDATEPGTACAQAGGKQGSEDCLLLNAFAPATPAAAGAAPPTYLFLHGGAFVSGDAWSGGMYDGAPLVRNESVCVFSAQYRLGVLGFLASPDDGIGGNAGLQDQRAAMQWVRANAARFGCDGTRLTVGGESAGAQSVAAHLASPPSAGLFSAAVAESDLGGMLFRNASEAARVAGYVFRHAGCGAAAERGACMRNLTAAAVYAAATKAETDVRQLVGDLRDVWGHLMTVVYFWSPTTGTPDLPVPVQVAFGTGRSAKVPWLSGTNREEADMFVPIVPWFDSLDGWRYELTLRAIFPDKAQRAAVLARPEYAAPAPRADATRAFSRLLTDYWFRCADLHLARDHAAAERTYVYQYTHRLSAASARAAGLPAACGNGSTCHGAELPFVFGTLDEVGVPNVTAEERGIARDMMGYWGAFIRGEALPAWPASTAAGLSVMQLGDGARAVGPAPEVCAFWDRIGYLPPGGESAGAAPCVALGNECHVDADCCSHACDYDDPTVKICI